MEDEWRYFTMNKTYFAINRVIGGEQRHDEFDCDFTDPWIIGYRAYILKPSEGIPMCKEGINRDEMSVTLINEIKCKLTEKILGTYSQARDISSKNGATHCIYCGRTLEACVDFKSCGELFWHPRRTTVDETYLEDSKADSRIKKPFVGKKIYLPSNSASLEDPKPNWTRNQNPIAVFEDDFQGGLCEIGNIKKIVDFEYKKGLTRLNPNIVPEEALRTKRKTKIPKKSLYIQVKERPLHWYQWRDVLKNQKRWKEEYHGQTAQIDPFHDAERFSL